MTSPGTNSAVAVVDIGSNSIKVLVAGRGPDGGIQTLKYRTVDARISAGISRDHPRLGEDGMQRGLEAIQSLLIDAAAFAPARTVLVGTSAVRDAQNGTEFQERVRAATGHEIRILSGDEEANLIGRGLTADPELAGMQNFYVFDLGGGSLECLAFREARIAQAVSLQLGCVRLTEKFVPDTSIPFTAEAQRAIFAHTQTRLLQSGFAFDLPAGSPAIGTGGTVSTARAILGERDGRAFAETSPIVSVAQLGEILARVGPMTLAERRGVPGLPPARADVFPTALTTLLAVAGAGAFPFFKNSFYNLRYGIAAELLAKG